MPQSLELAAVPRLIHSRGKQIPTLGIIPGTGFGGVARALACEHEFAYRDLPGFPVGTDSGHAGRLLLGTLANMPVAVLSGRVHYYEGFKLSDVTFPVRVLASLGVRTLLLTNAAGGIRPGFRPGDFMALADHLNLMGANPLRGPQPMRLERFVDLTQVDDPGVQRHLKAAAKTVGAKCHAGVYLAVTGPSFETPAEIRAFRRMGANAAGMSTVPEAIVARQHGLRVAALSRITNAAAGLDATGTMITHEEVLQTAAANETVATHLIPELIRRLAG
jgi:purine-nucleoside phosphorylase